MDGFDHYATNAALALKYESVSATLPTVSTTSGRRSGGALNITNSLYYVEKTIPSSATITSGLALYKTSSTATELIRYQEGATQHVTLYVDASGYLKLYRGAGGSGTLLATSTTVINNSSWYYLELKVTIDNAGAYELKINGVTEFSSGSADTQNGGTATMDKIRLTAFGAYLDDFYICDTTGSSNTTFLGDCRIDTLLPTGDGNYTQFTPSTGTSHYALVDDPAGSLNTTDYNSSSTANDRDSYTFPDLAGLVSQTVYGIQINAYAIKTDSGTRSLGTMSRLSGTNKDGAGTALGTAYDFISEIQETDPASAAWTESNVNAAEFGVKVTV